MLEFIALVIIVFVAITLFYGIIAIHDIPYEIAKHRNHPQQDALHVAGWVSLFTLHVLWPFLWIWAMLYREDRGWGFSHGNKSDKEGKSVADEQLQVLQNRIEILEQLVASQNNKSNMNTTQSTTNNTDQTASSSPVTENLAAENNDSDESKPQGSN
ncbi:MAG: DUF3302 domain-containing protein [Psychromonas sp.]